MSIAAGVQAIRDGKKKHEQVMKSLSSIPTFTRHSEDGDRIYFEILSDKPIQATFHDFWDDSMKRQITILCTKDEENGGDCEQCENGNKDLKLEFMFWIYCNKILRHNKGETEDIPRVKVGEEHFYKKVMERPMLLRMGIGKSWGLWNQFDSIYKIHGTWKNRKYILQRNGVKGDQNTTYTLTALDKFKFDKKMIQISKKLPTLTSVARGEVTKLAYDEENKKKD